GGGLAGHAEVGVGGAAGAPLDDLEGARHVLWERHAGRAGDGGVAVGVGGERRRRLRLILGGAAPAGPVQRGGEDALLPYLNEDSCRHTHMVPQYVRAVGAISSRRDRELMERA